MKEGIKLALYPFIGTVAMIIAWQLYVDLLEINPVVLPSPLAIYLVSVKEIGLLLSETWPTTLEIIYGFALAVILGVPMAVGIANTKFLNLTFYPILIAVQSVPKVAIAPIVLVWFGTGIESKLVIAFLVAFFPIVVDTATGLNATSRDLLDLARSLRATPFQTFMKVQFPSALPHFFSGAKVAVTLAVIGAVIGEFVGSDAGLGNLLLVANSQLDSPLAWAALIWLSVLGILLFLAVVLAERLIMPWGVGSQH
ncbi:MAG: ABC transporter permease [Rhodospirillales bacterium]|jgi:NitT/TauT family transport system permease protein|nr:ABC transporter permease [Rhodospirillaceae bacterium]MDP6643597.1 ABC transporter permease [Rhodospirillales bacterium]MDP6841017.1 ABC transporter permease [Rhodospirillales bacterium]